MNPQEFPSRSSTTFQEISPENDAESLPSSKYYFEDFYNMFPLENSLIFFFQGATEISFINPPAEFLQMLPRKIFLAFILNFDFIKNSSAGMDMIAL